MTQKILRYTYTLRSKHGIGLVVACALLVVIAFIVVIQNDSGGVIFGIFELSAMQLRWLLGAAALVFALIGATIVIGMVRASDHDLVIGEDYVSIPHGILNRKVTRVAFEDITSVEKVSMYGNQGFRIHVGKKKYPILMTWMEGAKPYGEAVEALSQRMEAYAREQTTATTKTE